MPTTDTPTYKQHLEVDIADAQGAADVRFLVTTLAGTIEQKNQASFSRTSHVCLTDDDWILTQRVPVTIGQSQNKHDIVVG